MTRVRGIAALTGLVLVLGAGPALADDEPAPPTSEPISSPVARLIATELGITSPELLALRDLGLGFGDIFRLKTLSSVIGLTIDEFLRTVAVDPVTGEYQFDWGLLRESLTEPQLALLAALPKNLGEIVSAAKRHHGRDEHQRDLTRGKPDDTRGAKPDDPSGVASKSAGRGGGKGRGGGR